MNNNTNEPISCARINNLMTEIDSLVDLIFSCEASIICNSDENLETLVPIIANLREYCLECQRGLRFHLEECKEWDVFPDIFWNGTDAEYHLSDLEISSS